MINVLLERAPNSLRLPPTVSVYIPNEDTMPTLAAIEYAQSAALREREAAVGIPTTFYDSKNPEANPLSDWEWRCENIADRLFSDQGGVQSHTISDTYRELDTDAPDGVRVRHDPWMLGTACLQAILTGVQLAYEEQCPPVLGANLPKIRYVGKALGAYFNVANRKARQLEKIQEEATAYLNSIMTVQDVTPHEAAYTRDIREYEEGRHREEAALLEQLRREAEWPEERRRLAAQRVMQRLSDPDHVARLRKMVIAKRAVQQ